MRLFVHIGTHKTGTTAVQHFLTANRRLLGEQGVVYPFAGSPPRDSISHGQHMLAWAITRPVPSGESSSPGRPGLEAQPGREHAWEALREELAASERETAVISSEEFDVLREPDQFASLEARLDGLEPRFVIYLRRQDEFLHSYYCTDVLFHRESRDFADYRTTLKTQADYEALLAPWEQAFGRDAITVRTYERPTLRDGDIVSDFCAEAGIETAGLVRPPRQSQINRAYPRNVINCVLWARRAGMPEADVASLRRVFHLVYRDRPSAADYLSPRERSALLREFRKSNRAVARRYLGRENLFTSLGVGDEERWNQRYRGELADLRASVEDARARLAGGGRRRLDSQEPEGEPEPPEAPGGAENGTGNSPEAAGELEPETEPAP